MSVRVVLTTEFMEACDHYMLRGDVYTEAVQLIRAQIAFVTDYGAAGVTHLIDRAELTKVISPTHTHVLDPQHANLFVPVVFQNGSFRVLNVFKRGR